MSFRNCKLIAFDRRPVYFDNLLAARRSVVGRVRISKPFLVDNALNFSHFGFSKIFRFGSTTMVIPPSNSAWIVVAEYRVFNTKVFFHFSGVSIKCQDGAHERTERCSQVNKQRRKAR